MSRTWLVGWAFMVGCADEWGSMCAGVEGVEAQDACVADAAEVARGDVDARLVEETDRVRDDLTRRELAALADRCRVEIDRLAGLTRERLLALVRDGEREREIRRGLGDIGDEVDRCDQDLRDLGEVRDPVREDDAEDRDDEEDRSGTTPVRRP